jgi:hypothetical protein
LSIAGTSPLSQWLADFKTACASFDYAEERRKKIPALGAIVKEKSAAATKEFWARNQHKLVNAREPIPVPRITEIREQIEIEQIHEDYQPALNALAINTPGPRPCRSQSGQRSAS